MCCIWPTSFCHLPRFFSFCRHDETILKPTKMIKDDKKLRTYQRLLMWPDRRLRLWPGDRSRSELSARERLGSSSKKLFQIELLSIQCPSLEAYGRSSLSVPVLRSSRRGISQPRPMCSVVLCSVICMDSSWVAMASLLCVKFVTIRRLHGIALGRCRGSRYLVTFSHLHGLVLGLCC